MAASYSLQPGRAVVGMSFALSRDSFVRLPGHAKPRQQQSHRDADVAYFLEDNMLKGLAYFTATAALASAFLVTTPADACGGCFVPATESTVVTGHRMALSVSRTQAVLWDQIQYAGDPADFSWVLPIKPGARVEVASDAFFEALDAATGTTVQSPFEGCASPSGGGSGFGCGASADALSAGESSGYNDNGVQVVHKGTVGPYETVTLSATDPNALRDWLTTNGYEVPDAVAPTVDAYIEEGFDFIALKLLPDKGVQQMAPVRVISDGMGYSLPLRMVAAGVGATVDLVLFVIGEGRYETQSFENTVLSPEQISWDFKTDSSDYAELRVAALSANEGRTWLTSYAQSGPFLKSLGTQYTIGDPTTGNSVTANTIAEAYVKQAEANGELSTGAQGCAINFGGFQTGSGLVVDLCDEDGMNCVEPDVGEVDSRELACGELDDIAVALTGLRLESAYLTRLEASLPVAALDADLVVEATDDQLAVASSFTAGKKLNACWDSTPALAPIGGGGDRSNPLPPEGLVFLTFGAAALYLAQRRRRAAALARA
jgi:hypothetical protein